MLRRYHSTDNVHRMRGMEPIRFMGKLNAAIVEQTDKQAQDAEEGQPRTYEAQWGARRSERQHRCSASLGGATRGHSNAFFGLPPPA